MIVRKVRINSVEDLEAIPEDEWVIAEGGINVPFDFSEYEKGGRALRIRLPPAVLRKLRPRRGRRLSARISRGELVVEEAD